MRDQIVQPRPANRDLAPLAIDHGGQHLGDGQRIVAEATPFQPVLALGQSGLSEPLGGGLRRRPRQTNAEQPRRAEGPLFLRAERISQ